jgi:hydrogenase nickel incorporation protein HypA/HybF
MHELSLATSIADIVHRHARGRRVTRVEVAVGHLRLAMPSALAFGFELASMGTLFEGAKLDVRQVPLRARCRVCGEEVEPETWPLPCPTCSSYELAISGGEELRVEAIEIDDGSTRGARERRCVGKLVELATAFVEGGDFAPASPLSQARREVEE